MNAYRDGIRAYRYDALARTPLDRLEWDTGKENAAERILVKMSDPSYDVIVTRDRNKGYRISPAGVVRDDEGNPVESRLRNGSYKREPTGIIALQKALDAAHGRFKNDTVIDEKIALIILKEIRDLPANQQAAPLFPSPLSARRACHVSQALPLAAASRHDPARAGQIPLSSPVHARGR